MLEIQEIISNIKSILKLHSGVEKIYDKEVASVLDITVDRLANSKKRGAIPYREILLWCHDTGVDAEFIFFGTKTEV